MRDYGISPETLLSQVHSSCPYALNLPEEGARFITILKQTQNPQTIADYFNLCMAAHWTTAGSFCPTDVDNALRQHLWSKKESKDYVEAMWETTLESLAWDYQNVTHKIVLSDQAGERVSTHEGTWFSVAVGAYAAAVKFKNESYAKKILELISWEMERESKINNYWFQTDAMTFCKLTALISHNLGDFDRVVEVSGLSNKDPLMSFYKLSEKKGSLWALSCEYYKKHVSADGHRNFALRNPKCLRKHQDLLIGVGPFHEDWGASIALSPHLTEGEKAEIAIELVDGWSRLKGETWGYARAYRGLTDKLPLKQLQPYWNSKQLKLIQDARFQTKVKMSRSQFESRFIKGLEELKRELL